MKSKIMLILNDELTYDYYKTFPFSKFFLLGSSHVKLYDNGYKNLIQNANSIPDKYKVIINPLHELYIYDKYEIDKFDASYTQAIADYFTTVSKFDWWYKEARSVTISDEMIDYLLSPKYKNQTYQYASRSWVVLSSTLSRFRYNAVDVYRDIAKLIGNENEVPEYVNHNFIKVDSANLKQYTGIYNLIPVSTENPSASESRLKISIVENHLACEYLDDSENGTDIYFRTNDEGYDMNGNEYKFTRKNDSLVSGCVKGRYFTLISGRDVHYEKIK
jgi:hypothetical protein